MADSPSSVEEGAATVYVSSDESVREVEFSTKMFVSVEDVDIV